ncbi:MAG: hypothetical protein WCI02_18720 [Planctomycetota bacterium]
MAKRMPQRMGGPICHFQVILRSIERLIDGTWSCFNASRIPSFGDTIQDIGE